MDYVDRGQAQSVQWAVANFRGYRAAKAYPHSGPPTEAERENPPPLTHCETKSYTH